MKETDILKLTETEDYIKKREELRSVNGFQGNEETEDDVVIIQLIVQGKPITVSEHLLTQYSKYFWNLFQNLRPLPMKNGKKSGSGKIGDIVFHIYVLNILNFD